MIQSVKVKRRLLCQRQMFCTFPSRQPAHFCRRQFQTIDNGISNAPFTKINTSQISPTAGLTKKETNSLRHCSNFCEIETNKKK